MQNLRCPTCKAPYKGGTVCYRCKSDLSILLEILGQADELRQCAIVFLKEGWIKEALKVIQRSLVLYRDDRSEKLEALIYASFGEFDRVLKYINAYKP